MNLTDTWKVMRLKHKRRNPFPTINNFTDITAYDIIQYTTPINVLIDDIPVINDSNSIDSPEVTLYLPVCIGRKTANLGMYKLNDLMLM